MKSDMRHGEGWAIACLMIASPLWAAPPTLAHVSPPGGQRGTKVVVTCSGKFSWPVSVWAPGIDAVPAKESGKLEITIPADLAADRVWIRIYSNEGASAAVPFLIGNLKELVEQEPNDRPNNAQVVTDPNVTINGVLASGDVDGYAVHLKAGQTLVAAVDANARLGSPMDAILQVATPEGQVLAENHDDVQLDPRLAFTAPKPGSYIVRLFAFPATPDTGIRFVGGANYLYRLTLTTGPFITHTVPLATTRASPGNVEIHGWNIPAKTRLPVVPYGNRLAPALDFETPDEIQAVPDARWGFVFAPGFAGAARVRLVPHDALPGLAQTDPKAPMSLTLPTSLTGCIRKSRQVDDFAISLKKGQPLVVAVEARTLDFHLDPVVKLATPEGAVVANVDDTGANRDVILTHVAAKDGVYRLSVTDRHRQGSDRSFYRLTARLDEPDFDLSIGSDSLVIPAGKPAELTIKVQRRATALGTVGPITIRAVGLPPTVVAAPVVSERTGPSAASVTLKFTCSSGSFNGPIRIMGEATQPKVMQRVARTPARLGAMFTSIWLTASRGP